MSWGENDRPVFRLSNMKYRSRRSTLANRSSIDVGSAPVDRMKMQGVLLSRSA